MSLSFQLHNINRSFERIAAWYTEFMSRTELCFRAMHNRILQLEERQAWAGPSDEQVERVLRKILAEKFSTSALPSNSTPSSEDDYFVENRKDLAFPKPILIDPTTLLVAPEAVPSKAYAETLRMLESGLGGFPRMELTTQFVDDDAKDIKMSSIDDKRPIYSSSV